MKAPIKSLWVAALVVGAMSGCGGGGGGYGGNGTPPPPVANPPPGTPSASVGFTSYSKQMQAIAEYELPWDVDAVSFSFDGDQDPAAYDDLLPPEA
jgi:predicted small lipoprotein YifL